ncbi:DUF1697 domain-containing protein [Actinophytocola sp.]|uniref:DUF1697 domain-containing protein n=1 Tax=Actinophytocola sp. TaxID=1872138 RepID=UPI002D800AA7|nr:DUF1697 domain-containing protein [Actinophytocola sp.]HET9143037.1 DUF1697 domain-containing protein [Actinophytocola sp.]HEU5107144.1 DUF1697 domain-containing protein [Micromonosporaceae bacterium]
MTRYVALLRGINVGGRNRVPMAALRTTCESLGCTEVATYIQSGNVVLTSPLGAKKLGAELAKAIAEQIGVAPAVMIRTHAQLAAVLSGNPFPEADPAHLHVAFLAHPPTGEQVKALDRLEYPPEELAVRGAEVYFRLPNGIGRAKLPEQAGRRLKIEATVRNWRTVRTMTEMSAD